MWGQNLGYGDGEGMEKICGDGKGMETNIWVRSGDGDKNLSPCRSLVQNSAAAVRNSVE